MTLFVWECPFPDDLNNFFLRWLSIENGLCRLWELKKGTRSAGEVVLDLCFDDGFADEVLRSSERGEFMPRFQEVGTVNVRKQPMDLDRSPFTVAPEDFR
jgi:hypothetical protein